MGRVHLRIGVTLTTNQMPRGFVVEIDVMEWIGQDFGHPNQAGLHVVQEEEVNRSEQQRCNSQKEPSVAHSVQEIRPGLLLWNHPPQTWVDINEQGQQHPNAEQNDFTSQVVAHLDGFLVFIGRLIDVVIPQGLKEEMPSLT